MSDTIQHKSISTFLTEYMGALEERHQQYKQARVSKKAKRKATRLKR